jgi:putative intracellular protease/amidase
MKILMILTSHKEMENTEHTTGLWLGEFTDPYYEFVDKGYEVTLASPKGADVPIDPLSTLTEHITASNRRFQDDADARHKLQHTLMLSQVGCNDYDALFIPGGHGPIWDLATNDTCGNLIVDFLTEEKPVAAVCHGPAALIKAMEIRPAFFEGKRMTCFTNMEESLVLRSNNIPYKVETRLKELGADFHSALVPFTSHIEVDGLLVTGQNPASAGPTAKALIELLETKSKTVH